MNIQKAKIMSQENADVTNRKCLLLDISKTQITIGKENHRAEVTRSIAITWTVFGKPTHILKNPEIFINLKMQSL